MTSAEIRARLLALATDLESDVALAQTRAEHMRLSTRVLEARRLAGEIGSSQNGGDSSSLPTSSNQR